MHDADHACLKEVGSSTLRVYRAGFDRKYAQKRWLLGDGNVL